MISSWVFSKECFLSNFGKLRYSKTNLYSQLYKVQETLNEIIDIKYHYEFRRRVFCVTAKLGLQMDAKQENLFLSEEWSNPERKEVLMRRIEKFLVKYII
ncbi:hypothetical protein LCGC14_1519250 [marine sediment metagenome]|uniref:Uncharacterized protein n=1 Tax=marine sediment metagenome TaxID=412755 RepID=A0A0F9LEQ8_9ZZZZ